MVLCLKKIDVQIQVLKFLKKILMIVDKRIDALEKLRKKPTIRKDVLFVSFRNDSLYINDLKIIDKKAKLQIAILKLLIEKHLIGNLNSTPTGLNTCQLSAALERRGFQSFDLEKNVRQSIYQTKKNIAAKLGKEASESFILSSTKTGQYRLGKNVVLICS